MTLLFYSLFDVLDTWKAEFARQAPDLDVRYFPDTGKLDEIDYALVWEPPPGLLQSLPKLKGIFSLGAGIDHLASDPDLPRHLPVTRVVDDNLTQRMTEWVVHQVLRHHLHQPYYDLNQRFRLWQRLPQPLASERRVGILGFGNLGRAAALALRGLGFDVAGYARSPKADAPVPLYHGPEGLGPFLARSDILVGLLPLTAETTDFLNRDRLLQLPRGAVVINAGRGKQIVDDDLLAVLDSGHLRAASLDVFRQEPLADDHPYWAHPKLTVTPHAAAITDPRAIISQVRAAMAAIDRGEAPAHLVDFAKGY